MKVWIGTMKGAIALSRSGGDLDYDAAIVEGNAYVRVGKRLGRHIGGAMLVWEEEKLEK